MATIAAGCGSPAARSATPRKAPATPLITADTWALPAVSGPPSTANFCTLLVATYTHEGRLPFARDQKVREEMVADYVRAEPRVAAAAPPQIAPAARTYLGAVAGILADMDRAGLDAKKVPHGSLGPYLLDPRVTAAGDQVLAFSQNYCHYTIGG
ncbi:MAG: hypothetical protein ACRDYY_13845 [Acidimicrobiales bacterium]